MLRLFWVSNKPNVRWAFFADSVLLHPINADRVESVEQHFHVLCCVVYNWVCGLPTAGRVCTVIHSADSYLCTPCKDVKCPTGDMPL